MPPPNSLPWDSPRTMEHSEKNAYLRVGKYIATGIFLGVFAFVSIAIFSTPYGLSVMQIHQSLIPTAHEKQQALIRALNGEDSPAVFYTFDPAEINLYCAEHFSDSIFVNVIGPEQIKITCCKKIVGNLPLWIVFEGKIKDNHYSPHKIYFGKLSSYLIGAPFHALLPATLEKDSMFEKLKKQIKTFYISTEGRINFTLDRSDSEAKR